MSNLNVENKKEMQKALDEILEENVSVETFQEMAARSLENAEIDKVNSMLLDYYNKKVGYNFQDSLRQQLKLMVNEKVLVKLNDNEDLEKSKEDKVSEVGNEENVDKDTLEKASKKMDEKEKEESKQKNDSQEYNFRAELMKQVYIEEFKKYSDLLYRLKERQAYDRDLTIGDKQGTELVLYERYLMNLEARYRGYANLNKLDEKTLNDNEEIKELKEKLACDLGKKEEYIDSKVEIRLNNFREMYQKRQEIAKKISEITDDKLLQQNPQKFKQEMDRYQEEYRKITYEMRVQDPTLEQYQEMIKIEQENKGFAQRKLGINSEVGFESGYSEKQKDIDEKLIKNSTEARTVNMGYKDDNTVKNTLEDLIRESATRINQDERYEQAEQYIEQAEDMLGIYENEKIEAKGKQTKISNQKLDKYMDKKISGKNDKEISDEQKNLKDPSNYEDPFTLKKECNDTKIDDNDLNKKLKLKERLKRVQEKYNEMYHNQKKDEKENDILQKSL